MQYDLALVCRDARDRIDVPTAPMLAIRAKASEPAARKAGWATTLIASISIIAVAAGAAVLGTRVMIDRSGHVELVLNNPKMTYRNPSTADVEAAVRRANFPVRLPAGLPDGSRLAAVGASDGAVMLLYNLPGEWRITHHSVWIVLANPEAVSSAGADGNIRIRFGSVGKPIQWRVGGEEVIIVMHDAFTPAEIARMKQAMLAASTKP
jgi:hypothetical protein